MCLLWKGFDMRTTIVLDDEQVAKAQAFTGLACTSSPTKVVALLIGSPFHECGVAAGGSDTSIVGLIRGYACRRGFQLFHVLLISSCTGNVSYICASAQSIAVYHVSTTFQFVNNMLSRRPD